MVWQCTQVGDLKGALGALEQAMALSEEIGDRSHDADVLGEIADTFADMGDFEQAAQVSVSNQVSCSCQSVYAERESTCPAYCLQNYDRCILAIQEEDGVSKPSAWDC